MAELRPSPVGTGRQRHSRNQEMCWGVFSCSELLAEDLCFLPLPEHFFYFFSLSL